jgi:hypothetical protein
VWHGHRPQTPWPLSFLFLGAWLYQHPRPSRHTHMSGCILLLAEVVVWLFLLFLLFSNLLFNPCRHTFDKHDVVARHSLFFASSQLALTFIYHPTGLAAYILLTRRLGILLCPAKAFRPSDLAIGSAVVSHTSPSTDTTQRIASNFNFLTTQLRLFQQLGSAHICHDIFPPLSILGRTVFYQHVAHSTTHAAVAALHTDERRSRTPRLWRFQEQEATGLYRRGPSMERG